MFILILRILRSSIWGEALALLEGGNAAMSGAVFCAAIVLILLGAVFAAEMYDRREEKRHRKMLKDAIRCKGKVRRVENVGQTGLRSSYPWRVIVDFELEGESYSIEEKFQKKPLCEKGTTVTVCIDRLDPWKSKASI